MCLGIPGVVIEVKDTIAIVDFGGVKREVDSLLVPNIKPGDYVIVHAGAIISKLSPEEAEETIKAWREVLEALYEM
ncbi:MAG: HypC/HybG/HupF family hydrogenase formation chaperone [Thermoprotei archaeon]|nr:MAG: HypC/HybG/HupF family hydrogenase formation chaperone [Thermoprotei archaeon]